MRVFGRKTIIFWYSVSKVCSHFQMGFRVGKSIALAIRVAARLMEVYRYGDGSGRESISA